MSALVDRAIQAAGLTPIADARRQGDLERVRALAPALDGADLLALGGLADRIRAEEVGPVVRVYANTAADSADDVILVRGAEGARTLKNVAIARITGPQKARVRLDWSDTGLELSQVALGFGVSELLGPIVSRRGLPIAADARTKVKGAGLVAVQAQKRKELEALIVRAGRTAVFVDPVPEGRQTTPETEASDAR